MCHVWLHNESKESRVDVHQLKKFEDFFRMILRSYKWHQFFSEVLILTSSFWKFNSNVHELNTFQFALKCLGWNIAAANFPETTVISLETCRKEYCFKYLIKDSQKFLVYDTTTCINFSEFRDHCSTINISKDSMYLTRQVSANYYEMTILSAQLRDKLSSSRCWQTDKWSSPAMESSREERLSLYSP